MDDNQRPPAGNTDQNPAPRRGQLWPILLIVLFGFLVARLLWPGTEHSEVSYDFFLRQLADRNIRSLEVINGTRGIGVFKTAPDKPPTFDEDGEEIPIPDDKSLKLSKKFSKISKNGLPTPQC